MLSDLEVQRFLAEHPDFFATFVLPGWMHGPGDAGPTSAGQTILDYVGRKLPGVIPGSVAFVDARDVALAHIQAERQGRRGERYLAAGRHLTMGELFSHLARVTGIPAPRARVPLFFLFAIALVSELFARVLGRPALLSLATVRILAQENERTRFSADKGRRELGITFRPVDETLADAIRWFVAQRLLDPDALAGSQASSPAEVRRAAH